MEWHQLEAVGAGVRYNHRRHVCFPLESRGSVWYPANSPAVKVAAPPCRCVSWHQSNMQLPTLDFSGISCAELQRLLRECTMLAAETECKAGAAKIIFLLHRDSYSWVSRLHGRSRGNHGDVSAGDTAYAYGCGRTELPAVLVRRSQGARP